MKSYIVPMILVFSGALAVGTVQKLQKPVPQPVVPVVTPVKPDPVEPEPVIDNSDELRAELERVAAELAKVDKVLDQLLEDQRLAAEKDKAAADAAAAATIAALAPKPTPVSRAANCAPSSAYSPPVYSVPQRLGRFRRRW